MKLIFYKKAVFIITVRCLKPFIHPKRIIGSPDTGGYVKFTHKYIVVGCAFFVGGVRTMQSYFFLTEGCMHNFRTIGLPNMGET